MVNLSRDGIKRTGSDGSGVARNREGYTRRTKELKERYGPDVFRRWGKKGGNPALVKPSAPSEKQP